MEQIGTHTWGGGELAIQSGELAIIVITENEQKFRFLCRSPLRHNDFKFFAIPIPSICEITSFPLHFQQETIAQY